MTTETTVRDVRIAEDYLDLVSRRGEEPSTRARAKILIAVLNLLEQERPSWREDLVNALDAAGVTKAPKEIFSLANTPVVKYSDLVLAITASEPQGAIHG